jgi:hypothetical protein
MLACSEGRRVMDRVRLFKMSSLTFQDDSSPQDRKNEAQDVNKKSLHSQVSRSDTNWVQRKANQVVWT